MRASPTHHWIVRRRKFAFIKWPMRRCLRCNYEFDMALQVLELANLTEHYFCLGDISFEKMKVEKYNCAMSFFDSVATDELLIIHDQATSASSQYIANMAAEKKRKSSVITDAESAPAAKKQKEGTSTGNIMPSGVTWHAINLALWEWRAEIIASLNEMDQKKIC